MEFLKELEPSLTLLFFALFGVYRLLLKKTAQPLAERSLKALFLVFLALALAFFAKTTPLLLFLGLPFILVLERVFDQRPSFDNLIYGIPLSYGLMAWAWAIRQLFITLGPGWFRIFPLLLLAFVLLFMRPLKLPQRLAREKDKVDSYINDEGLALFALVLFAALSGLLYVILRPAASDLVIDLWQTVVQGFLLLLIVYLDRVLYRLRDDKELLLGLELNTSLHELFAKEGIVYVPDEDFKKILGKDLSDELERIFKAVLPLFARYVSGYFKRRQEAGRRITLKRLVEKRDGTLYFSLLGQVSRPLTKEQMTDERAELLELKKLLKEYKVKYFEEQDGNEHKLTLVLSI